MRAVFRFLFVIPFGFIAACLAAAFALLSPFLDVGGAGVDPLFWIETGFGFTVQAGQVGSAALVPWGIFMAVTEVLALRSILLHAGAGALGGIAYAGMAYGGAMPQASVRTALVVAGLSFALVYWLVAGRRAGSWRERAPAAPVTSVPPVS
ncbi:hypothetical protein [Mangrovicella endophytica]|uniref:hypothetical protein n=1 Tax=Mangrovicella endophytica TaxID=2066697 RepID=UPI000C9E539E|nr:hypothetical protein [Mangrovicella endophytica]